MTLKINLLKKSESTRANMLNPWYIKKQIKIKKNPITSILKDEKPKLKKKNSVLVIS
jgi:hypothetical protein